MKISLTENYDNYYFSLGIEYDPNEPSDRKSAEALIDKFFKKATSMPFQE